MCVCVHTHGRKSGRMIMMVFSGRGLIIDIMGDFRFLIYIFLDRKMLSQVCIYF